MKRSPQPRRRKKKQVTPLEHLLAIGREFVRRVRAMLKSVHIQRRVRRMQLQDRLALTNKHSVVLFRVDNQEFLVGCTGDSIVLLGSNQSPAPIAAAIIPTKEDLVQSFQRIQ